MPAHTELNGKTYQVINTLAATLAQATLKSSPAEKAIIAKEFARAFEILSKRLAEVYSKAPPKDKLELEKVAHSLFEEIVSGTGPAPCCVGFPRAKSFEECVDKGGSWACMPNPIKDPLTP